MSVSANEMCSDIFCLLSHSKSSIMALAEAHGLTSAQLFSLYSLDQKGEISMGGIAASLHCDASNVTGIVDRLTAQGLVVRRESSRDRRAKTLVLTEKGKATVAALKAAIPVKFGSELLTEAERETFHAIVKKVCACS